MGEVARHAEVSVSDPSELRSLREHLRQVPGVDVGQAPGIPGEGELGVWDVLQLTAVGSGALAVAVRTLPAFIRSRRSSVTVTVKTAGKTVTVTAQNVDEAMPIVEKALDA
ncbi:effector-associated constant component EACC1 [Streptomyces nojiriensis]